MWSALDRVGGQCQTMAGWRKWTGDKLPLIQPYLRPTQELARALPCRSGYCSRAVIMGDEQKYAVCGEDPPECDPVPVSREEILLHDLHRELLAMNVGKVLDFQAIRLEQVAMKPMWRVGTTGQTWKAKVPVLMAFPKLFVSMEDLAREALVQFPGGFLFLGANLERVSPQTRLAANKLGAGFVDLVEALEVTDKGDLLLRCSLANLAGLSGLAPAVPEEDRPRLERTGATWTFHFMGKSTAVKDSSGMPYLRMLLQHPGREFHVLELAAVVRGDGKSPQAGDAGNVLDAQAIAAFKARYRDLETKLETARTFNDLGKQEILEEEMEALEEQLRKAMGLGGRQRKAGSDTEKNRQTITRAIRRVTTPIYAANPELATHLHQSLRLGSFVEYAPGMDIRWAV